MKTPVRHSALFALIGLVLSPLAVAHASPSPADRSIPSSGSAITPTLLASGWQISTWANRARCG